MTVDSNEVEKDFQKKSTAYIPCFSQKIEKISGLSACQKQKNLVGG